MGDKACRPAGAFNALIEKNKVNTVGRQYERIMTDQSNLICFLSFNQDTKRVYHDEINLIEVELLGREHYERMQRDRQIAEETGAAQLQRLQENILQTRIKYNRAKHQYYFPSMKGFKYV
jgi:hypothetical protein